MEGMPDTGKSKAVICIELGYRAKVLQRSASESTTQATRGTSPYPLKRGLAPNWRSNARRFFSKSWSKPQSKGKTKESRMWTVPQRASKRSVYMTLTLNQHQHTKAASKSDFRSCKHFIVGTLGCFLHPLQNSARRTQPAVAAAMGCKTMFRVLRIKVHADSCGFHQPDS
jgi:hypothetical protein